jgi:hypothetical protein
MKYLKNKNTYINEAFDMSGQSSGPLGNDINWGDSLVGRMFSSISRRFTTNYSINKIGNIAEDIESEFDALLASGAIKETDKEDEFNFFKISYLLGELKRVIDEDSKKDKILENVENLVDFLSEIREFKNDKAGLKQELEDSLSDFEEYLKSIDNKEDSDEEDKVKTDSNKELSTKQLSEMLYDLVDSMKNIYESLDSKGLLKNTDTDDDDIDDKTKTVSKYIFGGKGDESKSLTKDKFVELFKYLKLEKSKDRFISLIKKIKTMFSDKVNEESNYDDNFLTSFAKSIVDFGKKTLSLENEKLDRSILKHIKDFNKSLKNIINLEVETNESNKSLLMGYKQFMVINEKSNTGKEIKEFFYNNVVIDNWVVDEEKVEDIKKTVEDSSKNIKEVDLDPILSIVKLFNRAFKVYTTMTIPSSRSGGKVSNRVFRRYTKLSGSSGTPDSPGVGPFKINKVFDKFEDKIQDIIRNEKYRPIFDKDTVIELGDGRKVKGGGKILLNFIQELLDGEKLYNGNAQSKFFKEYFGLNVSDKKIGTNIIKKELNKNTPEEVEDNNDDNSSNSDESVPDTSNSENSDEEVSTMTPNLNAPKNDEGQIISEFKEHDAITDLDGTIYSILIGKNELYYLMVLTTQDDYVYVKYSRTFLNFDKYLNEDFDVKKGDLKEIEMKPKIVFFGKISKEDFDIVENETINIKAINILEFNTNNENVKPQGLKNVVARNIFQLKDKDGNAIQMLDIDKTFYGPNDSKNYKDMIKKLN